MMAGLIEGAFGDPAELAVQRRFFESHLAPWATQFFDDLERAQAAVLYAPVGNIGSAFMAIEGAAFAMIDE
jgi:TorA maturation chaperone TorD